jgi:hypothetical protein
MTLTPELAIIIVAIIGSIATVWVGILNNQSQAKSLAMAVINNKALGEVHVIVNNRYSELAKKWEDSNAEVKFLTAALAEAKLITLTDRLAKLEEIKKANGHE